MKQGVDVKKKKEKLRKKLGDKNILKYTLKNQ